MASWGETAVGTKRPTALHPGKAAVLGLLAAALGLDRDQDETFSQMSQAYGLAVLVESAGLPLRDYHTAQVPDRTQLKKMGGANTRAEELSAPKLGTILSSRDYRTDGLYYILLWQAAPNPPYSLAELAEALKEPKYHLYLGRKSCPLGLPLQPKVIEATGLKQACGLLPEEMPKQFEKLIKAEAGGLFWEDTGREEAIRPRLTNPVRDLPLSRRRWQFAVRQEHFTPISELKRGD